MREDICSIPVNDIFEEKSSCPFCHMRDMLEDRIATYITGAAMMEPDVRVETNRLGFCKNHFDLVLSRGSRLSVALILESHLKEIEEELVYPKGGSNIKKLAGKMKASEDSCFICENVEKNMKHLLDTVFHLWQTDPDFRSLYSSQEYICLPHFRLLLETSEKISGKNRQSFLQDSRNLCGNYLRTVEADVTHFCRMFDYRNKDASWGNSKDSIERSIYYITSRTPKNDGKADERNL